MRNEYPNTITGIIIVFSLLFSFCLGYYTMLFVTRSSYIAMISGISSIIIVVVGSGTDFYLKINLGKKKHLHNDIKPKGINENKTVYPSQEDLANIPLENHIKYDENHIKKANPVKGIKDPVDWEENYK